MNKSISNKIKYLYFFLTLGMVMYHAQWLNNDNIKYLNSFDQEALSFYLKFANHIGTICMCFFFFMSAFWFYYDLNTKNDLITRWKKRIKTLLIPFLLWTIILLVYKILFSGLEFRIEDLFYHVFESPVAGPLWYLLALLLLQLISPLLLYIKKYKKITTIFLLCITAYIVLRSLNYIPTFLVFKNWWWYENLIIYTPMYLLGAYLGMYYSNLVIKKEYIDSKYTIIGLILLLTSFILWHFFTQVNVIFLILYSLIELVGIWFVLKPSIFKKNMPKILNCNFYIYALHNPILIPLTQKAISFVFKNSNIFGIEMIFIKLIQIVGVLVLSILIKYIIVKLLPDKVDYYLTGGR